LKNIATWIRECDAEAFDRVFRSYPDMRLWNGRIESVPEIIDGVLLTGGEDISEKFLRQAVPNPGVIEDANPERDVWEFDLLARTLRARSPLFVICRGLQVLNVELGGTLHLDIPNHDKLKFQNVQALRYAPGAPVQIPRVNSSHHQALDRLGTGVEIEAWCAEDDVIEQARLRDYPFGSGVQYHPERDPLYQPLFDAFVQRVRGEVP
jgi:putative glutamine amidotransferase